jgi:hypothetical protein
VQWDDLQRAARARGFVVYRVKPSACGPAMEARGHQLWVTDNRLGRAALARKLCLADTRTGVYLDRSVFSALS